MTADRHVIAGVSFERGTNDGPAECICGWDGLASTFADHRKEVGAGAPKAHVATGAVPSVWKRSTSSTAQPVAAASQHEWRPCAVAGCGREAQSLGYCNAHYLRHRNGRPLDTPIRPRARRSSFAQYQAAQAA
jgi:hypothetical protein